MRGALHRPRAQAGFAYIAAIVFLVVIAGIAVALLRLTDTQQSTVNQAVLGARAGLAARAGIEWVFHQPTTRCDSAGLEHHLTDFRSGTGFLVTVKCTAWTFFEGERPGVDGTPEALRTLIYRVEAVACNGAGSCPGNVSAADYVERARTATICMRDDGKACDEGIEPPPEAPVQP